MAEEDEIYTAFENAFNRLQQLPRPELRRQVALNVAKAALRLLGMEVVKIEEPAREEAANG